MFNDFATSFKNGSSSIESIPSFANSFLNHRCPSWRCHFESCLHYILLSKRHITHVGWQLWSQSQYDWPLLHPNLHQHCTCYTRANSGHTNLPCMSRKPFANHHKSWRRGKSKSNTSLTQGAVWTSNKGAKMPNCCPCHKTWTSSLFKRFFF